MITINPNNVKIINNDQLVTEAILILVESRNIEAVDGDIVRAHFDNKLWIYKKAPCPLPYWGGKKDSYTVIKPILISETEKPIAGDPFTVGAFTCWKIEHKENISYGPFENLQIKVLALPEHFSRNQKEMIVYGNLTNRNKIYLELTENTYNVHDQLITVKFDENNMINIVTI